jgi:uncharacterized protein (TIGR03435 family)
MNLRSIATSLALAVTLAHAQQPRPAFEVASIRPHAPDDTRFLVRPPGNGHFTATGSVAKLLLMLAFDVQESQIAGGPAWLDKEKWDIEAKSDDHSPHNTAETRQMLRNLLIERFALQTHRETRQLPVYILGVSKGVPKFKPQTEDRGMNMQMTSNSINLESGEIQRLAQVLSTAVGRPVIDRTGLTQRYDLSLTWDDAPVREGGLPGLDYPGAQGDNGSVFTAVQNQLGLRLDSQHAPVEVIVVDRIERPSRN